MVGIYKQTVLGPIWFILQPLLMTATYIIIFGRIAKLPNGDTPALMFYLSGIVLWNYFTEVTTGAGGDLQQLSGMARQMVTRFGMSDLGPLSLESQQGEVFLGRDWTTRSEYSEAIACRIDAQVRMIVEECYSNAKNIMRDHRSLADRLVDLLIEKETINGDELRQIVAEYAEVPDKSQFAPML
jgi:hypothetical protein